MAQPASNASAVIAMRDHRFSRSLGPPYHAARSPLSLGSRPAARPDQRGVLLWVSGKAARRRSRRFPPIARRSCRSRVRGQKLGGLEGLPTLTQAARDPADPALGDAGANDKGVASRPAGLIGETRIGFISSQATSAGTRVIAASSMARNARSSLKTHSRWSRTVNWRAIYADHPDSNTQARYEHKTPTNKGIPGR